MRVEPQQLKLFLLDSGLVTSKDIEEAEEKASQSKKDLGAVLVEAGKITEEDFRRLQAYILGIPFVDLKNEKINFDVLSLIPEPIARTHNIVSYKRSGDDLEVAMLDPDDLGTIDFIKKKLNLKIKPRLTDATSIKNILNQYNKTLQAEFGDIIQKDAEALKFVSEKEGETSDEDLKKMAEEVPVVRIVDTLLRHAILQRASDIHIEPMEKEVMARYRIDGILRDAMVLPKSITSGIIARIKVLSNLKLDEKRLPQDGRFKIESGGEKVSFRVSTIPIFYGEKAVLRILRENAKGFTLESLGFLPGQVEDVQEGIKRPHGLILATGPTGCGKTTTLYTILEILNTPEVNIATIEDPIEYQMPRVNQTQVRPDIGFSFAEGLRSLVRQDPDIIMVGEIRDKETASLAINAALTGHLVLSTLHTNSAAGAIPRLLDMGAEPFLMASTLNIVIAQRLVRRLCSSKDKYVLTKSQTENLRKYVDIERVIDFLEKEKIIKKGEWEKTLFYKPKESKDCPDGFQDRIGIHEVLKVSESIKSLIMSSATSDDLEKQAKKEGMVTMFEDGVIKSSQGITALEEIMRVTRE